MPEIKKGLGPDHIVDEVNSVGDTVKNGIGPSHIKSTVENDGVIKTGLGPDHIEDTVDLIPTRHIVVANREITWADLPAWNQTDNGSLKLLSTEVKDNVPVVVETGEIVERHNPRTKELELVPETVVHYETRATYTYEADFDWDNRVDNKYLSWLVDVLEFKNNKLKTGYYAFYGTPAAELTALPDLDTSNLTNMSGMFSGCSLFNQPLDNWDTSNVEVMDYMFYVNDTFDQPLNNWNTSKLRTTKAMFERALVFDQPLNNWDTSNVTSMKEMFRNATSFNQPLNNWNTSSVINNNFGMVSMFNGAKSFNQDISNWCVEQFDSKPGSFDLNSGFEGQTARQPQWRQEC